MVKILKLCFLFAFISCTPKEEIPQGVLSKDKMSAVMADIQLAEAAVQSRGLERNDSTQKLAYGYYKNVFIKHNITPEEFKISFQYYSEHLSELSTVYDEVITLLNKRQAEESNK